eukprot:gnl/Trimastix_PCT/2239.p1 GENE.gnl/Trimastix_PCT/2239~~gnl/Trimastix_PCT/2239.p1  ORF type:complete len:125 (+),score=8.87 gnl/Trimastix_PCT/2239:3-377(+)
MISEEDSRSPRLLSKETLRDLLHTVDPSFEFDPEVEKFLVDYAQDFVNETISSGASLAHHRHSSTLEVKDVRFELERKWKIIIAGFHDDSSAVPSKPRLDFSLHNTRLKQLNPQAKTGKSRRGK